MALTVFLVAWLIGVIGTFVPVLPATLIIFLGALAAAFLEDFQRLSWPWLVGIALVTLFASLVDNLAGSWGARKYGGSRAAAWGALLGSLVGLFLPFGLLIGPALGALTAELLFMRRPLAEAVGSVWGTLVGLLTGIAAKFVLHVLIGVVVLWRLLS
ncbi:DUF456 domain-containing protein [Deinococcus peraridilitoris]|uniref:Major facilitator superfamily (MFS) profile domain-containing protein n=1 Tax=Deinococcus peraridilitoris (strain DSM 19664 / LMG 22246 / CIP 109416 / KR-200) TaxID=937777 RepID=K9ZX74_DEIPD|nr:DUF456 family protein [Deinococcus peraridilitoris]AFZ66161.1 hypothetical protein Deipe_0566 [Deinococcus peraridilitoris DSM 19664]